MENQPPQDAGATEAPQTPRSNKFKVVSKVVMAMRRFKESINPTYSFGKRSSSSGDTEIVGPNSVTVQSGSRPNSGRPTSGRSSSGRTSSGRPISANHHGHKAGLLFRPLPKLEQEVAN